MEDLVYSEKIAMTVLTIIITIIYIYILYRQKINIFDKIYLITNLVCIIVFYIFLWNYNSDVIYILHILHIIFEILSIFTTNKYLIFTSILKLLFTFSMWIITGRCPLKEKGSKFIEGRAPVIGTYIISSLISIILIYPQIF